MSNLELALQKLELRLDLLIEENKIMQRQIARLVGYTKALKEGVHYVEKDVEILGMPIAR